MKLTAVANFMFFVLILSLLLIGETGHLFAAEDIAVRQKEAPLLTPWELKQKLDRFEPVIIIDVRSKEEFNSMHIAGAISVPLDNIESFIGVLPRDMNLVFY